ncbi:MAG: tRNA (adenosine(37)-N6)-threonylcarbamoyltransferase complex transferase subunit TsaD [Legionella sp. 21-45-4]|nr:MAG: tRNA (adenosine(37)-N6)-threonylcarbamoyltransferase complex transferase subunit TsaD [Legionella sp. 21-45-4]
MIVVGIESSCDETGVAVYCATRGLLSHVLHSQVALHGVHGGVVPELASRNHVLHIVPVLEAALQSAQITQADLSAVAYTAGPGLIGALLVGATFAKSLAFALNIPAIAVHHLEAHLMAARLEFPELDFPFTALLVSGGHTQLLDAEALGEYELLGETLDDAVGEAFDKIAKRIGLGYPGGARLAQLADACPLAYFRRPFPRPMLDRPGMAFSFSGLKTHAMMAWEKSAQREEDRLAIASAFQDAVVETLVVKTLRALEKTGHTQCVVAGGVGANRALRERLTRDLAAKGHQVFFPKLEYCTDNGAMVAYTGYLHFSNGARDETHDIVVKPRWPLRISAT